MHTHCGAAQEGQSSRLEGVSSRAKWNDRVFCQQHCVSRNTLFHNALKVKVTYTTNEKALGKIHDRTLTPGALPFVRTVYSALARRFSPWIQYGADGLL